MEDRLGVQTVVTKKLADPSQSRPFWGANGHSVDGMGESGREQPTYTLPGVLHFMKYEWSRFEKERANWETERAELQVSQRSWRMQAHYAFRSVRHCLSSALICNSRGYVMFCVASLALWNLSAITFARGLARIGVWGLGRAR